MKKNKLFTLFSLTLLSMGTPLTSIAQVVAVSQDTPAITTASNEETENTQDKEAKPVPTDEDKKEAEPVTTDQKKTDQEKSDKKETETKATDNPKNEVLAPSVKNVKTGIWGSAPWSFDTNTGTFTIDSGALDDRIGAPWDWTRNVGQVKKIVFTGPTKATKGTNSVALFSGFENLTEIVGLTNLDTSESTSFERMFRNCKSLTTLDLSSFNTEKVTSMQKMFYGCRSLTTVNLSNFNTKNKPDMAHMFNEVPLSSLTLGDNFRFRNWNLYLKPPRSLFSASDLMREGKYVTDKWMKKDNQSAAYTAEEFADNYGKGDLTAGTYVAEIEAPLLWGDAPYTFDEKTGTLTIESGRLVKSDQSPWKRDDDKKIDGTKIKKIIFTGPVLAPEDSTDLFDKLTSLTEFENLTYLDTSEVTNMTGLFKSCKKLKNLDLSGFNTSNVQSMTYMFKETILYSLTLGDDFTFFGGNINLSKPDVLTPWELPREGKYLTGNWIKKDNQSAAYDTEKFMTNYGKGDLKAGTYVAETKSLLWGDAPWAFDSDTGILTINSGTLGQVDSAPWRLTDGKQISPDKIKKISFSGATKAPENADNIFKGLSNLTEFENLTNLGTSETTSMVDMFRDCTSLTTLNLSQFNTKKLKDIRGMFRGCTSIKSLDLSSFDTSELDSPILGKTLDKLFENVPLVSLTLGDSFRFIFTNSSLSKPKSLLSTSDLKREGKYLTGKWIKKDNQSAAYSVGDFMANYGKGDLTAGTYVADTSSLTWGDAPWAFDSDTGILIISPGTLDKPENAPWKLADERKIDADKIKKIRFTGATKAPEDSTYLFRKLTSLTEFENLTYLDTSEVTNMTGMFYDCYDLEKLDLSNFNTSNVTSMERMFFYGASLESLDLSKFDTKNVTDMTGLFFNCEKLKTLDISGFNTIKKPTMTYMFDKTILSSLTLGDAFRFVGDEINLPAPAALNAGDPLTGKWIKENRGSYPQSPGGFMKYYGKNDLTAGTYVAEIEAPLLWGDAPYTFDENTGTLTIESGRLGQSNDSPWNRQDDKVIDKKLIKKIIFTGPAKAPKSCLDLFAYLTSLEEFVGLTNFDTSEVDNMAGMFRDCKSLTNLDLSKFSTLTANNMNGMFRNCTALTSLDLSNFDTSRVTTFQLMFSQCKSLKSINLSSFNTTNVTYMAGMFSQCSLLLNLDLSNFDTANVKNMSKMFYKCNALETLVVSSFNTAKVTAMENMFSECNALTNLDLSNFDTAKVTNMENMFSECNALTSLNLSSFNTPNVTNMANIFYNCSSLKSLDLSKFDTANVTNMEKMFSGCQSLLNLDLSRFRTKKVTNMNSMLANCKALETLDISGFYTWFDVSGNNPTMTDMFSGTSPYSVKFGTHFQFPSWASDPTKFSLSPLPNEKLKEAGLYPTGLVTEINGKWAPSTLQQLLAKHYGKSIPDGTYMIETRPIKWGDARCSYDPDSRTLTVNSGNLYGDGPWITTRATSSKGWEINNLKKIVFTGKNKLLDSTYKEQYTFTSLGDLEEIIGLENVDVSDLTKYRNMFNGCRSLKSLNLSNFDNTGFATSGDPLYRMFLGCDSLSKITLGDKLSFSTIYGHPYLPNPKALNNKDTSTGKWIREDGNSKAYSPTDFMANYGKGDLTAGTYIAEVNPTKWGDAIWTFDATTGTLTVNSGTLEAGSATSPWKRTDGQEIDASRIRKIVFTGKTQAPENSDSLFSGLSNLTEIVNLTNLDTSQVTNMSHMFIGCKSLKTLDLSQFNTSNVTLTEWMFQDCASLTELNLKSFDTSKLTKMWMMFSGCASLTSLDLSNFDTKSVVTMGKLFYGCSSLTSVNLSSFDTSQVTHMGEMFQDCTSLTSIDLSSFDTGNVTTMQKLFLNTPLSSLTLGVKFKSMGTDADLPIPTALNAGDQLTGNWIRKDGQSKAYSPKNFMANYGKEDLQAGTYVGELISSGAILETNISFSTDSGKTVATTAVIGDQLQAKLTVKHSEKSPTDATANDVKLSTISLLTDAWALSPTVTVRTFDQTGKQTASNEQTIKNNELSLPTLPFGSYVEITLTGTAWEKAYTIPGGNYNYTLSYNNQAGDKKVKKSGNFVINSGAFGFKSVPNISFKDNILPIKSNQIIDRKDADYAISVTDYRGTRLPDGETAKPDRVNWEITATASPFKDAKGKEIKLSTMAVSFTKAIGQTTELGADATLIRSHDVTGETAKQNNLTKLSWAKELGFKVVVHNRTDLDTTKYTADVAFDLRTAP